MPKFIVHITETVESFITIDAESPSLAMEAVKEGDYNSEDQSEPESLGNVEVISVFNA
jgi:hypothetical protein